MKATKPIFSYFLKPVWNTEPFTEASIKELYEVIKTTYKDETLRVRELQGDAKRKYKTKNFDSVCFAGTFEKRSNNSIKELSGLMCLDIDHDPDILLLKEVLPLDKFLDAQLIFTSPSGDGLKVIISNPYPELEYSESYLKVMDYFLKTYGRKLDNTQDIARGCYICHDPEVWIKE